VANEKNKIKSRHARRAVQLSVSSMYEID